MNINIVDNDDSNAPTMDELKNGLDKFTEEQIL